MELNINSPVYYKDHYEIDGVVYRFCQRAYLSFKDKNYSNTLQIIGIIPIVALIEIKMNFDNYYNANSVEKIELTKEMILKAVKQIITKVDFDYNRFRDNLMNL